jgi:Short repeat of unknown function (DUF308)
MMAAAESCSAVQLSYSSSARPTPPSSNRTPRETALEAADSCALLVLSPGAAALALLALIAAYAIVFGILLIIPAFRLRGFAQQAR